MELQDPSPLFLNAKGELYVDKACHVKNGNVLSQNPAPKQLEPTVSDSSKNTKGVVRVLGIAGRDIPSGKHHELFIPMNFGTQIPIPSAVVDDFHAMADERTAESTRWGADNVPPNKVLPYHPIDTPRNDKKEDKLPDWDVDKLCFRLKAGDLVYFRPNKEGTAVEEIALSAIWRGKADADTHGFFGEIDEELLPFHRKRKTITPAEALFGFVEEVEEKQKKPRDPAQKPGLALASRVRFSAGMYAGDPANAYLVQQGREQTLKILGQPKPPCPSLYFKHRGNGVGAISKTGLSKGLHEPQGRKMYLHHRAEEIKAQCWITSKPTEQTQLKTAVRPVNALRSYHFHLDFDNLTNAELGLLLYSLRPNDEFRHKLGMGKSLGLGTVRVDVAGVFLVDRISRYSSGSVLSPKRFTWVCDFKPNLLDGLAAESYQREIGEARGAESKDLSSLRFLKDEKACRVLESIGNPTKMSVPVKPPISPNQNDPERETFRWFVENQQQLVPVNPDSDTLPKLSS